MKDLNYSQLTKWYSNQVEIGLDSYPIVKSKDHSMGRALFQYIKKAVPFEILDKIIEKEEIIEIHGLFDGHIGILKKILGWDHIEYFGGIQKPERIFKSQYPKLYRVKKNSHHFFIFTVFPGKDYVDHNASLIRNYIERRKPNISRKILKVYRYPLVEDNVYVWTGIKASKVVRDGDIVLTGYGGVIDELYQHGLDVYDVKSNDIFMWIFLKNKQNRRILYFGFYYVFWGSIIGRIAKGFYEDGAKLVIHLANLGSCREPEDVGSEIFIPMIFSKIEPKGFIEFLSPIPNPILQENWEYNSGIHVCVRSLLDETYEPFRRVITRVGATSVETEAFHIAKAAEEFMKERRKEVGFSGIYFATDYVRKSKEASQHLYSLANKAKIRKIRRKLLPFCCKILADYLNSLK